MHAVAVRRRQLQRADALDGHLPALALDVGDRDETRVERERTAGMRTFEAHQELVAACGRLADRQRHGAPVLVALLERASGDARELVPRGQLDVDRARFALHDGDVDQRDHAHIRITERHERHDVGHGSRLSCGRRRRAVAHRPPDLGGRARRQRGFDHGSPAGGGTTRYEARRQVDVGLFARQVNRRPDGAGRRRRQRERRAAGRERQRRAPLERERERTGPRQQRRVCCPLQRRAPGVGPPPWRPRAWHRRGG